LAGAGIFLIATAYRLALGPTQPPTKLLLGALSPGGKVAVTRSWPLTSI